MRHRTTWVCCGSTWRRMAGWWTSTRTAIRCLPYRRAMEKAKTSSRSEERRVGKECRSRCDWSSDVCTSDLLWEYLEKNGRMVDVYTDRDSMFTVPPRDGESKDKQQIGRASCRERV